MNNRALHVTYTNNWGYTYGYFMQLPNGRVLRRRIERDQNRRLLIKEIETSINGTSLGVDTYSYDALTRPTTRNSDVFQYNAKGGVSSVIIGTNVFTHTYDLVGNQLEHTLNSTTNHYQYNSMNQVLACTGVSTADYSYSDDGELTSDGKWYHVYDVESRLISSTCVDLTNGATRVRNCYDYRHRRIGKTVEHYANGEWFAKEQRTFFYNGCRLTHEMVERIDGVETNLTEVQYFWGVDLSNNINGLGGADGVGGLLAVSIDGSYYIPIADNKGNILKYVDENGVIVASCSYDDFGRMLACTGSHANMFNLWSATKYFDRETALYYYGYRFYSPEIRRWLTRDPLGEIDGTGNLYLFVKNNFIAYFDGLGLKICIIKHLPGEEPLGGWGDGGKNNAETHYRRPDISYQRITYTNGKVRYKVSITPQTSFVDIYFKDVWARRELMSDESDHLELIQRCDAAIELFKTKVEAIYDCPKPAAETLSKYLNELYSAYEEFDRLNNELEKKGGKHGH